LGRSQTGTIGLRKFQENLRTNTDSGTVEKGLGVLEETRRGKKKWGGLSEKKN